MTHDGDDGAEARNSCALFLFDGLRRIPSVVRPPIGCMCEYIHAHSELTCVDSDVLFATQNVTARNVCFAFLHERESCSRNRNN